VKNSEVPGLLPPQWVTDFAEVIRTARPFISAFDARPLPNTGMTVNYPSIGAKPMVGKMLGEKLEVPSRKTTVATNVANVETFGGGEDISIQVIQRTEPSYLTLVLELYAEQMATAMDTEAISIALAAIVAPNELTIDSDTPASWVATLADGAAKVLAANAIPDTFVAGMDIWKAFASAVDSDGRPLFPHLAPSNPVGSISLSNPNSAEVRGLSLVFDPNMPPTKGIMGWSRAFVSFVGPLQTMSADNPAQLGRDYAVFQMGAFAVRRPDALVEYTLVPVP
jgi:hypothetical protein